jgi:LysR family transcriptional regulator, low CO2-responsive transcriptional regulator
MNYTLHQLLIFLKVTELKSITKASEQLFLSQPAVSIQLKNFLDQFKEPLLEIIGKKVFVTDFGNEVVLHAKEIMEHVEEIKNKSLANEGFLYGTLKIAVVSTGKYVMPYFLSEFLNIHKEIKLEMDVTNKENVIESLKNNKVDFALVSIVPDSLMIDSIDLMPNIMFMIGNENIEIDSENSMEILLKKFSLIFRENGSGTRLTLEKYIKEKKLNVQKKIELQSNEAVKQAILANIGISLMPILGLKNELQNKTLKIIPSENFPLKTNWQLIWLKEKKLSYLSKSYISFIKENKNHIIEEKFNWIKNYYNLLNIKFK